MNKLRYSKINFENEDFLVEIDSKEEEIVPIEQNEVIEEEKEEIKQEIEESELILNRARAQADEIVEKANLKARKLIEQTKLEIEKQKEESLKETEKKAKEIIDNATNEAQKKNDEAKETIKNAQQELEDLRAQKAREGYEDGYKDGLEKGIIEQNEKFQDFDNFCEIQKEIEKKVLKKASNDIINVIQSIARKVLLKNIDCGTLGKIIDKTVELFDKQENFEILLSEKYYNILLELEVPKNYNIISNKELKDDTIIVLGETESYSASIGDSIESIIEEIYKSAKGEIEIENYLDDEISGT